jgi:hypothetical protein
MSKVRIASARWYRDAEVIHKLSPLLFVLNSQISLPPA